MMKNLTMAALLLLLCAARALAQFPRAGGRGPATAAALPAPAVGASTATAAGVSPAAAASTATEVGASTAAAGSLSAYLGNKISRERGPWVLGEVIFLSANRMVSDYTWRDMVRGQRGSLYTNADIAADTERLMGLKSFDSVDAALYEIPGTHVPAEYQSVAVSSAEVRLVYTMVEKRAAGSTGKPRAAVGPAPISGVVFTPTAYRSTGRFATPGLGLDINAVYYIGRLYGKNSYPDAPYKTNYLDRLGVWLLTADGKMQLQSETKLRPAIAVGAQATALLRDSAQPQINQTANVTVSASNKSVQVLTDGYFVASKKFGPTRASLGVMQGTVGNLAANLSEFLTPEALLYYKSAPANSVVKSQTVPFASFFFLPRNQNPLGLEFMKFQGATQSPWLVNLKIGYFIKLNFDIAYLKYQGGYDVLGLIQFRYNYFPKY